MNRLFTFETTHHALWAEQVAEEQGIGAQVVPAPEGLDDTCGLAIETLPEDREELEAALEEAGVPYQLFPEAEEADA